MVSLVDAISELEGTLENVVHSELATKLKSRVRDCLADVSRETSSLKEMVTNHRVEIGSLKGQVTSLKSVVDRLEKERVERESLLAMREVFT